MPQTGNEVYRLIRVAEHGVGHILASLELPDVAGQRFVDPVEGVPERPRAADHLLVKLLLGPLSLHDRLRNEALPIVRVDATYRDARKKARRRDMLRRTCTENATEPHRRSCRLGIHHAPTRSYTGRHLPGRKEDLYVILSLEEHERDAPGLAMIRHWIEKNLPSTPMEPLAPSEHSGIIEGGIGRMLRVDFTPEGLAAFCERWEKDEASIDPRFQCFVHPYADWYRKRGRFVPTRQQPQGIGPTVWIHTPQGFVHHQLEDGEGDDRGWHPAMPADLWIHVPDLWPELASYDFDRLAVGRIGRTRDGNGWQAVYVLPFDWGDEPSRRVLTPDDIRTWFGLPAEAQIWQDECL